MTEQPSLPGFAALPDRPRRRCQWREELCRALQVAADERVRDQRRHTEQIARLAGQVDDLRHRLADIERSAGIADLRRPPVTSARLRDFARS